MSGTGGPGATPALFVPAELLDAADFFFAVFLDAPGLAAGGALEFTGFVVDESGLAFAPPAVLPLFAPDALEMSVPVAVELALFVAGLAFSLCAQGGRSGLASCVCCVRATVANPRAMMTVKNATEKTRMRTSLWVPPGACERVLSIGS
jgi:hypothetical protein